MPMTKIYRCLKLVKSAKSVGPIRGRKFLDESSNCQCLKSDPVLQNWNQSFINYFEKCLEYMFLSIQRKAERYTCLCAMKTWKCGGTAETSTLDGGKWAASHPVHFTPWCPLDRRLVLILLVRKKSCFLAGNRTPILQTFCQ